MIGQIELKGAWLNTLRVFTCVFAACMDTGPAQADSMIDFIIQNFQNRCDAIQAQYRGVDDDLDAPLRGTLTLPDDAVYDLQLTPDGKTGTVLYNDFSCTNIGRGWCGTGGCGFHIIVDGVAFDRMGGFRPFSVTADGTTFIMMPIHGGGCETSEGVTGAGVNSCYVVATWDEDAQTFRSKGGEIDLSPFNP